MVRRIIFLNGIAGRLHHCQIRNHPRTMFLHGLKLHQKKYGRSSRSVEAMRAGVSGPTDCDPRQRVLTTRKNLTENTWSTRCVGEIPTTLASVEVLPQLSLRGILRQVPCSRAGYSAVA